MIPFVSVGCGFRSRNAGTDYNAQLAFSLRNPGLGHVDLKAIQKMFPELPAWAFVGMLAKVAVMILIPL